MGRALLQTGQPLLHGLLKEAGQTETEFARLGLRSTKNFVINPQCGLHDRNLSGYADSVKNVEAVKVYPRPDNPWGNPKGPDNAQDSATSSTSGMGPLLRNGPDRETAVLLECHHIPWPRSAGDCRYSSICDWRWVMLPRPAGSFTSPSRQKPLAATGSARLGLQATVAFAARWRRSGDPLGPGETFQEAGSSGPQSQE